MKAVRRLLAVAPALLLCASGMFAGDGVLIVETRRSLAAGETSATTVHLERDRVLVLSSENNHRQGTVFLGDSGVMRLIDFDKKTYREMTKQDFEQMGSQVNDAMAQAKKMMEERMKDMPPEQRQMMEQMMKQRLGQAPMAQPKPVETVYTRTSSGKSISPWTCDTYEGHQNGEKRWEVCAADWGQLDLSPADFEVFQKMAELFKSIVPQGADQLFQVGSGDWQQRQGYPGVPVLRIAYRNGAPYMEYRLTELSRKTFDDSLFEVPSGFQKIAVPNMKMPQ